MRNGPSLGVPEARGWGCAGQSSAAAQARHGNGPDLEAWGLGSGSRGLQGREASLGAVQACRKRRNGKRLRYMHLLLGNVDKRWMTAA
jgi:hypothetical protein